MSSPADDYNSYRYVKFNDVLDVLGFTKAQQESLPPEIRARYLAWTKEANNKVEALLFPNSDAMPLNPGSKEEAFARSAALNWVIYKKRDREGSRNAKEAKENFESDIEMVKNYLKYLPSQREAPALTLTSDSLANVIYPYSQTQGYPPDLLY